MSRFVQDVCKLSQQALNVQILSVGCDVARLKNAVVGLVELDSEVLQAAAGLASGPARLSHDALSHEAGDKLHIGQIRQCITVTLMDIRQVAC